MSKTLSKESVSVNKKRWAAYAAAGVAATLAGPQSAEAEITHVVVGSPGGGDITIAGATQTFSLGTTDTLIANVFGVAPGGLAVVFVNVGSVAGYSVGSFPYASNLAFGLNVSTQNFGIGTATATLAYGNSSGTPFFNTGGYIAFRFNGMTQFGWARFSLLNGAPDNEYTLEEYAFSDGEPITIGQTSAIPEPTSLGLLALGAIGVMANRRRKVAS